MKKTTLGFIVISMSILFLSLFLSEYISANENLRVEVSSSLQVQKKQRRAVRIRPIISEIKPEVITLQRGGPSLSIEVIGRNLNVIGSVMIIQRRNTAQGISVSLDRNWPKERRITLKANSQAIDGRDYQLRLLDSAKRRLQDVSLSKFRIIVISRKAVPGVVRRPTPTEPQEITKSVSRVPVPKLNDKDLIKHKMNQLGFRVGNIIKKGEYLNVKIIGFQSKTSAVKIRGNFKPFFLSMKVDNGQVTMNKADMAAARFSINSNLLPEDLYIAEILPPPSLKPDITVTDIKFMCDNPQVPGEIHHGDRIKIIATVKNTTLYQIADIGDMRLTIGHPTYSGGTAHMHYYRQNHALSPNASIDIVLHEWAVGDNMYTFVVEADYNNKLDESNENNNERALSDHTFEPAVKPDLRFAGLTHCKKLGSGVIQSFPPYDLQEGDVYAVKVFVKNGASNVVTPVCKARLTIEQEGADYIEVQNISSLAAGETETVIFSQGWSVIPGKHNLTILLDYQNVVAEMIEYNNTRSLILNIIDPTLPLPDLIVESIEAINDNPQVAGEYHPGDVVKIYTTIKNTSGNPTSNIGKIQLGIGSASSAAQFYFDQNLSLAPNSTTRIFLKSYTIPNIPSVHAAVKIDYNNQIDESNEQNNVNYLEIEIQ